MKPTQTHIIVENANEKRNSIVEIIYLPDAPLHPPLEICEGPFEGFLKAIRSIPKGLHLQQHSPQRSG